MSQTDFRTLINRGRKAGLRTAELYAAIASRPLTPADCGGRADGNGFIASYRKDGRLVYQPVDTPRPG